MGIIWLGSVVLKLLDGRWRFADYMDRTKVCDINFRQLLTSYGEEGDKPPDYGSSSHVQPKCSFYLLPVTDFIK